MRRRHKWGREPLRSEYETVRTCVVCGLRKITDHNIWPPTVWYGYSAAGEKTREMPECQIVL